ncbi:MULTISPECIES: TniB family NTP-binding protein [unclassified Thalassospira]|jgi:hypothetical protein|uniref:TniB family NTP-binding protein n=1 Tax=unclassified Thalassospira TaxID=2648997 RepID=UPI0009D44399|nr:MULTISPECIES: TniB family NTP-binding protein [unclassified Thalassospira]MBO9506905.1 TniB family NTP-binding protein [Thalassospira sp. A3_1]ONH89256.1 TniB [Thalassospira sp. MCCC 1A02803]HAI32283.1 hypothetical protein [Thalassospira sp.]|tara:strand:+ start:1186 stop:2079 length:894 start_codon:yes stop_codon:yes gene_type:complete
MTEHLHSEAAKYLEASRDEQIHWLNTPKWFPYDTGNRMLEKIEAMIKHPPTHRMPSMMLVGETNNGKTMILEEALSRHPRRSIPEEEADQIPVIFITMPPGPELRRFYKQVLDKVGAVHRPSDTTANLESQVLHVLKGVGTRLIIIDELHNISEGKFTQQRQFLNMLRFLSNELRLSFICAGTKKAIRTIQTDDQLANRFKPYNLPEWKDGKDYRRFLYFLESTLPLPEPSNLHKSELARTILTISERTVGEMVSYVKEATFIALDESSAHLKPHHFEIADYTSPSRRKAEAEQIAG